MAKFDATMRWNNAIQNGLAKKKGATNKIRTGDRQPRAAEVTPFGLCQTVEGNNRNTI
jgi:hypothetical protein